MAGPRLVVKPPAEYTAFTEQRVGRDAVWYWRLSHKLGLGDRFMPRAWYSGKDDAIYVDAQHRNNHQLLCHEFGHAIAMHHPNSFGPALLHAIQTGFSTLAFSGLLRWRRAPAELWAAYEQWLTTLQVVNA